MTATTGVVIAGGRGRRMGLRPKGLASLRGEPLIVHVLHRLAPQVTKLMVNANDDEMRAFLVAQGHRVIADRMSGHLGPLAGLHAALAEADTDWIATAPCDAPFLPPDLVERLRSGATAASSRLAYACALDRQHPLFCLIHKSLLPEIERYLITGERRVITWFESVGATAVGFDDEPRAFENINTPDDLERAERPGG